MIERERWICRKDLPYTKQSLLCYSSVNFTLDYNGEIRVGFTLKIVVASTPEQEHHITELIDYMYSSVFPVYFEDEYIGKLEEWNVLAPKEEDVYYNRTLDKAFKVISSLQAIIAVLETIQEEGCKENHVEIFTKNVQILNDYGYLFPFTIEEFQCENNTQGISKYSKPANKYLA